MDTSVQRVRDLDACGPRNSSVPPEHEPRSWVARLRGEVPGQAEQREQRFHVEERGHARDAIPCQLEHDERPWLPPTLAILAECGRAAGCRRHQPRVAAPRAPSEEPGADGVVAAEPERMGWHRE